MDQHPSLAQPNYSFGTYRGLVRPGFMFSHWFEFLDLTIENLLQDSQKIFFQGKIRELPQCTITWDNLASLGLEEVYLLFEAQRDLQNSSSDPGVPFDGIQESMVQEAMNQILNYQALESWDHILLCVSNANIPNIKTILFGLTQMRVNKQAPHLWILIKEHQSHHFISQTKWEKWTSTSAHELEAKIPRVVIETSEHGLMDMGAMQLPDELAEAVELGNLGYLAIGESWLTSLKELRIPGVIITGLTRYITKTWTGDFHTKNPMWYWIPKACSMESHVQLYNHPDFTLTHLLRYAKQNGFPPNMPSLSALYEKQIQSLFDFFSWNQGDNNQNITGLDSLAPQLLPVATTAELLQLRKQVLQQHLKQRYKIDYHWNLIPLGKLGAPLTLHPSNPQNAMGVDWIELPPHLSLEIQLQTSTPFIHCRDFKAQKCLNTLWTNWLFFLTPRVVTTYNESLTKAGGSNKELINLAPTHLDFCMDSQLNHRQQFPLFPKAIIYQQSNGSLGITHARHTSGTLILTHNPEHESVNTLMITWTEDQIIHSPSETADALLDYHNPVLLITPGWYNTPSPQDDNRFIPRSLAEHRFNLVIVGGTITVMRFGKVFLPPFGVLVSLDPLLAPEFLAPLADDQGYVPVHTWSFKLELENPTELNREVWKQIRWAYGGAYTLIHQGKAQWEESLEKEQWTHSCAKASQESDLSLTSRHPRTVLSIHNDGKARVFVFAGRSFVSPGVTYQEIGRFLFSTFPDIVSAVNLDGGASSFLGLGEGESFYELSMPALTYDSCTGRARPVFSTLQICLDTPESEMNSNHS